MTKPKPIRPIFNVSANPLSEGGICLSKDASAKLAGYLVELEAH